MRDLEQKLADGQAELESNLKLVKDLEAQLIQYKTDYSNLIAKVPALMGVAIPIWTAFRHCQKKYLKRSSSATRWQCFELVDLAVVSTRTSDVNLAVRSILLSSLREIIQFTLEFGQSCCHIYEK